MADRPRSAQNKDEPFRDALRMAVADAEGDFKALRRAADALISKALTGDVAAVKEVADRLDEKVAQAKLCKIKSRFVVQPAPPT